jgi:hypothetical protein
LIQQLSQQRATLFALSTKSSNIESKKVIDFPRWVPVKFPLIAQVTSNALEIVSKNMVSKQILILDTFLA